ncbi:hypothetical protein [uncultured Salinicola sp.]|uniref:hypothetical protein n=1 Tax=uncultured Salinicola sp. TaxID=1193542 RepID=UPI00262D9A35|nr:hypothetical protein [uncultured Salinicola sp.]
MMTIVSFETSAAVEAASAAKTCAAAPHPADISNVPSNTLSPFIRMIRLSPIFSSLFFQPSPRANSPRGMAAHYCKQYANAQNNNNHSHMTNGDGITQSSSP